jgi:hypothetical protein
MKRKPTTAAKPKAAPSTTKALRKADHTPSPAFLKLQRQLNAIVDANKARWTR